MGCHFAQRSPGCSSTAVDGCLHMHAEKCALGEHTCGEAVSPERRKPAMNAVVMHVGVDKQRYQHVAIQQPLHLSSSSTSIWRTVSAVMGFFPREITKRLCFAGRAERRDASFAPPGKDRRNQRFKVHGQSHVFQSGAVVQWCQGCGMSNPDLKS